MKKQAMPWEGIWAECLLDGGLVFGVCHSTFQCLQWDNKTRGIWVQRENRFQDTSFKEKFVNGQYIHSNPHFIVASYMEIRTNNAVYHTAIPTRRAKMERLTMLNADKDVEQKKEVACVIPESIGCYRQFIKHFYSFYSYVCALAWLHVHTRVYACAWVCRRLRLTLGVFTCCFSYWGRVSGWRQNSPIALGSPISPCSER